MKITTRKNYKGENLVEWTLKEEHDEYFILENEKGEVLNFPKVHFESQKEHLGASREGNKFFIPQRG